MALSKEYTLSTTLVTKTIRFVKNNKFKMFLIGLAIYNKITKKESEENYNDWKIYIKGKNIYAEKDKKHKISIVYDKNKDRDSQYNKVRKMIDEIDE